MKIVLVHNFYGSAAPSGENRVVMAEMSMLQAHGHEVHTYFRHSDEIRNGSAAGLVRGALATPWNPWSARSLARLVQGVSPDVVHVHNTFPLISPSVLFSVPRPIPMVATLHNYRIFCSAAIPMRQGRPCTQCLQQQSALPSVVHGCYRGSRLATIPLAMNVALHRSLSTWNRIDAFIALSDFQKQLMAEAGLAGERLHVKPNFVAADLDPVPWEQRDDVILFVGRLSAEKGVATLIRAWGLWGADAPRLHILGDGDQRHELEALAKGLPIRFFGQVSSEEVTRAVGAAKLVVVPSEWYETFGLAVAEAFAAGTPVAASAIGPLPGMVEEQVNGVMFPPGDPAALLSSVHQAWEAPRRLREMGINARLTYDAKYSPARNYNRMMSIYEAARVHRERFH